MTRTAWVLLLGVLSNWLAPAPSVGALIELTWTGEALAGGNDGLDLFGLAGEPTGGLPYTATYVYDTDVQFSENVTNGSQQVSGGTSFDPDVLPIPLLSASVTLNGAAVGISGQYASAYTRQSGQGASQISSLAQREATSSPARFGGELFQRVFRGGNHYDSPLLEVVGSYVFTDVDSPGGEILYVNLDDNGFIFGPTTQIQLIPSGLVIRSVQVPEPAAGLMAAFAASVLGIRRR